VEPTDARMTHLVGGLGCLEVGLLEPASREVERDGSVEEHESVRGVEEALLLVWLECDDCEPEVERRESDNEANIRRRLARDAVSHVAHSFRVVDGGEDDGRDGEEGEREHDVESKEAVEEVKGGWRGAVEIWATGRGEDVVVDDVEGDDRESLVRD
jgi:hypothetical protein